MTFFTEWFQIRKEFIQLFVKKLPARSKQLFTSVSVAKGEWLLPRRYVAR